MAFWGVEVKPGKPFTHTPLQGKRLHLSLATLGTGTATKKNTVQCNVGTKAPVFLCSLFPGKDETCQLHLEFQESVDVVFSVIGPQSVHLSGYYLGVARHCDPDDETESYGEDIADSETQRSVDGSDGDEYEDSFIDDNDDDVDTHSSLPDSSDGVEETLDRKRKNGKGAHRRLRKKYQVSESDDESLSHKKGFDSGSTDMVVSDTDSKDKLPIAVLRQSEASAKSRLIEAEEKAAGEETCEDRKKRIENGNCVKSSKRKADVAADGDGDLKGIVDNNGGQSADENLLQKKKKKKKSKTPDSVDAPNMELSPKSKDKKSGLAMAIEDSAKLQQVRTVSNELVIEELETGKSDAMTAAAGKRVHVRYIGKLKESGKVVDSNGYGAPLKFRLGKGKVLQFFEAGVDGMRVGGKRRLTVPPSMGHGSKGDDGKSVPPNAWLEYDVELMKVK